MLELIFAIIFILSLGGVLFILARKIPVLATMPQNGGSGIKKHKILLNVEERIKKILIYFEKQILLHKILSWIKVITLKLEVKLDHLLHGIRKKAQEIDKDLKSKKV